MLRRLSVCWGIQDGYGGGRADRRMDEQVGRGGGGGGEGEGLYRLTLLFILHADANKEGVT